MGTDLYPSSGMSSLTVTDTASVWPTSVSGNEIDLREEFHRFLYGYGREVAKGQIGILRRMRTNSNGNLIECDCVDSVTHEPDLDMPCAYCDGEGYYWDEEWTVYYKMLVASQEGKAQKDHLERPGMSNVPHSFLYFEYSVNPGKYDRLIEMARGLDGDVDDPYERQQTYTFATVEPLRSDNGRVEYWRVAAYEDSVVPLWRTQS